MNTTRILNDYSSWLPRLEALREELETSLSTLLRERGPKFHSLSGRTKSMASLKQKVSRPDRSYEELWDITDLVAFRIVTYSEALIEEVAHLIERSFDVDFKNSTNKLRVHDESKFGYRSLHYVTSVPEKIASRTDELPKRFRFEIQIRTSLQHTWAEIEHGLGYKASAELPFAFRRRFSQIASLLEIADRDFDSLRKDIEDYERRLRGNEFSEEENVGLDEISLRSILGRTEVAELDRIVSEEIGRPLADDDFYPDYLVRVLRAADLKSICSVLNEIKTNKDHLRAFVKPYFEFSKKQWNFGEKSVENVRRGYALLFLAHLAVLKGESLLIDKLNRLVSFYQKFDYPDDLASAQSAASELIAQLKEHSLLHESDSKPVAL